MTGLRRAVAGVTVPLALAAGFAAGFAVSHAHGGEEDGRPAPQPWQVAPDPRPWTPLTPPVPIPPTPHPEGSDLRTVPVLAHP